MRLARAVLLVFALMLMVGLAPAEASQRSAGTHPTTCKRTYDRGDLRPLAERGWSRTHGPKAAQRQRYRMMRGCSNHPKRMRGVWRATKKALKDERTSGDWPSPESIVGADGADHLRAIAECESGGDPRAVDPSGTYRGKYQFDYGTWGSVHGHGDPAAAAEAEQDYRAALLLDRSGSSPWPVCG